MDRKDFRFIRGECSQGAPADICFYTDVESWSAERFLEEFDYLATCVRPSKIRVHVNSAGGSVVDGMSVYAKIADCKVPTECVNDGLAASMGSVIWAAGDELYMRDYALLMVHNPFCGKCGEKERNQATEAFGKTLRTIYTKRFGLSEDEIGAMMDGGEGEDGTFLTAAEAVERGFLPASNVIETPKAVRESVEAALREGGKAARASAVFALAEEWRLPEARMKDNPKTITMEKNEMSVSAFAALLGVPADKASAEGVVAAAGDLKARADKAEALQKDAEEARTELAKARAELAGAQTSVKNLSSDLEAARAELGKYKAAEAEAKEARVSALVDQAVADCKINKDERELYAEMARGNYELAASVLSKIPARDKLGKIVSGSAKDAAREGMRTEQEKVFAKVEEVVGKDFRFRSLE